MGKYNMELAEEEVKIVGQSRWIKKNRKEIVVGLVGIIVFMFGFIFWSHSMDGTYWEYVIAGINIVVVLFVLTLFSRKLNKAGNNFLSSIEKR